jgi:two-component system, NtrC family, response regulator HydG
MIMLPQASANHPERDMQMHNAPDEADWFGVDVEDLSARLRFNPKDAHIWLGGERMILMHVAAFARLRQDLIERLGVAAARELLERLGGVSGTLDAEIARRSMPHAGPLESFKAGPRLHAIEGMVVPEEIALEVDPETGMHFGEWFWRHSAEAEAHLERFGKSAEPVCWTLIGYASAFSSAFMGRPILYRELECRAMGAQHCRIVGRPAAMWEDSGPGGSHLAIDLTLDDVSSDALSGSFTPDSANITRVPNDLMAGASAQFSSVMLLLKRYAETDAPILILGEPGVGKKSAGRAVHKFSRRNSRRLSIINCGAYDEDSLDAELFGRERSLAEPARPGLVEKSSGGTLVLEDVQAMPPRCQAKLLHMMVTSEFTRRGESQPRASNVRIVACGNDQLMEATKAGQFRQDLYFRLAVCPVQIPPLRERRGDIPVLIRHFLEILVARYRKPLAGVSLDAVGFLLTHDFPGNVAELESLIERAVILANEGDAIQLTHLQSVADLHSPSFFKISHSGHLERYGQAQTQDELEQIFRGTKTLEEVEVDLITKAVSQCEGNLAQAAKLLGLTRPQLAYRYRKISGS